MTDTNQPIEETEGGVLKFEAVKPDQPQEQSDEGVQEIEINYEATIEDEEKFMLMYFMNMQPSEVDALSDDRRRWILARFQMQKGMEREAMAQKAMMAQINAGGGLGGEGLVLPK